MNKVLALPLVRYLSILLLLLIAMYCADRVYNRKFYACIAYLDSMNSRMHSVANDVSSPGVCATQVK